MDWLTKTERPVTIELGAGIAIATVRRFGSIQQDPLIRINPTDETVGNKEQGMGIRCGALEGIAGIYRALQTIGFCSDQ